MSPARKWLDAHRNQGPLIDRRNVRSTTTISTWEEGETLQAFLERLRIKFASSGPYREPGADDEVGPG